MAAERNGFELRCGFSIFLNKYQVLATAGAQRCSGFSVGLFCGHEVGGYGHWTSLQSFTDGWSHTLLGTIYHNFKNIFLKRMSSLLAFCLLF